LSLVVDDGEVEGDRAELETAIVAVVVSFVELDSGSGVVALAMTV
jgi:hypothetical protein